jgi:hypothetical protein
MILCKIWSKPHTNSGACRTINPEQAAQFNKRKILVNPNFEVVEKINQLLDDVNDKFILM